MSIRSPGVIYLSKRLFWWAYFRGDHFRRSLSGFYGTHLCGDLLIMETIVIFGNTRK